MFDVVEHKKIEEEVKEQGLKVIDSRLVIKEKADGMKARLCAKDFAHTKRDDLCAAAQPSGSQDSADASTQKRLDHEYDRLRAGISSRTD